MRGPERQNNLKQSSKKHLNKPFPSDIIEKLSWAQTTHTTVFGNVLSRDLSHGTLTIQMM